MTERPLSDLHRHLDGGIRQQTLEELAEANRRYLPRWLRFESGMSVVESLGRFGYILPLLQTPAAVQRVAAEACEDAAAEGVTTLELRFAPQLHRGADPHEIVDAALAGIDGRAGLIVCGLHGESPEVLEGLVDVAKSRPGVVGIDLAGAPDPTHRWILEDYREAFAQAAREGLGRTVHASEGRSSEEIQIAIEVLGAQRLGHATTVLEDRRVIWLVRDRGVVIEACLTSNVVTGVVPTPEEHPISRWLDEDLKVCVNTDYPFLCDTTIPREFERVERIRGVSGEKVERLIATGHAAAFQREVSAGV